MMETKEELLAQARAIREKLDAIEDIEQLSINRERVGRCFAYRDNRYSMGQKTWDVFYKVLGLDENKSPIAISIQIDCDGKVEYERRTFIHGGVVECDESEFNATMQKAIAILSEATGD